MIQTRSFSDVALRIFLQRAREPVKVLKDYSTWRVIGVFLASREFPQLIFWLPFVDSTGKILSQTVSQKTIMASLSPNYNSAQRSNPLLHVRVAQRIDAEGRLMSGERYICTDIAVSYRMGDNAFPWINFQYDTNTTTQQNNQAEPLIYSFFLCICLSVQVCFKSVLIPGIAASTERS